MLCLSITLFQTKLAQSYCWSTLQGDLAKLTSLLLLINSKLTIGFVLFLIQLAQKLCPLGQFIPPLYVINIYCRALLQKGGFTIAGDTIAVWRKRRKDNN